MYFDYDQCVAVLFNEHTQEHHLHFLNMTGYFLKKISYFHVQFLTLKTSTSFPVIICLFSTFRQDRTQWKFCTFLQNVWQNTFCRMFSTLTSVFSTCSDQRGRPVCSRQDSNSPESKWTHLQCSEFRLSLLWTRSWFCGICFVVPFSHKLYGSQRRPNGEGYVTNWFTVTAETEEEEEEEDDRMTRWRADRMRGWRDPSLPAEVGSLRRSHDCVSQPWSQINSIMFYCFQYQGVWTQKRLFNFYKTV